MVFIGLRVLKVGNTGGTASAVWKNAGVMHFNPAYIKLVDEKKMVLTLDDNTEYRVDDESLQIFLAAMYGEQKLRGDKLDE